MITTQLLSEDDFKAAMPIKNVDAAYIAPAVQLAQDLGLQPMLGTHLLETICTMVETQTINDPANTWYKRLLDGYIQPYMVQQTMYELEPMLFVKARNAGMVQAAKEGTSTASHSDSDYIRRKYAHNANLYGEQLKAFLTANAQHYPEWHARRDVADMPATTKGLTCGIYLG